MTAVADRLCRDFHSTFQHTTVSLETCGDEALWKGIAAEVIRRQVDPRWMMRALLDTYPDKTYAVVLKNDKVLERAKVLPDLVQVEAAQDIDGWYEVYERRRTNGFSPTQLLIENKANICVLFRLWMLRQLGIQVPLEMIDEAKAFLVYAPVYAILLKDTVYAGVLNDLAA